MTTQGAIDHGTGVWATIDELRLPDLTDRFDQWDRDKSIAFGRGALKDDIATFGLWLPLLVYRRDDGAVELIDGVSRLEALRALGADRVPVEWFKFRANDESSEIKRLSVKIARIDARLTQRIDPRLGGLFARKMAAGDDVKAVARSMTGKATAKVVAEIEAAVARARDRGSRPLWFDGKIVSTSATTRARKVKRFGHAEEAQ